ILMLLVLLAAFAVLAIEVYTLQLGSGDQYALAADQTRVQTIGVRGMRGKILDANGVLLAYDKESFDVAFTRDPTKRKAENNQAYTQVLQRVIGVIESNGGTVIDSFSVVRNGQGEFYFKWEDEDISDEAKARREENYRKNMYATGKDYQTPEDIYLQLRQRYQIPEDMPYEQARKLLSIWQESQLSSYMSYIPVKIAKDVNMLTVAVIENMSHELDGITVEQSSTRVYPKSTMAAHTIGYTGRMVDEDTLKKYTDLGYSPEDLVGVTGIEQAMEAYLTGNSRERQGQRTVEINSLSKVTRELDYLEPENGDNVILSMDISLQKVLEDALANNIEEINALQKAKYDASPNKYNQQVAERGGSKIKYAETGAAVVMDPNTGKVLAMANVPSFDINSFVGGISFEEFKALNEDPLTPLFNRAIASKATPGSTFKMVTAAAGLMEGAITPEMTILDEVAYAKHGIPLHQAPKCWNLSGHGALNVIGALQNSCNYFFFETAYRLGPDNMAKWGENLGLTQTTGIEIGGEIASQVSSPDVVWNPELGVEGQATGTAPYIAWVIREYIRDTVKDLGVEYTDEKLNEGIAEIFTAYVAGEMATPAVRKALTETIGIPATIVTQHNMAGNIVPRLTELRWSVFDTITTGMGQSRTLLTPIGAARYVSALVNGGKVLETQLVDRVVDQDGNTVLEKEPVVSRETGIDPQYADIIKQGMKAVIMEGTAASNFANFKYRDIVGAKTGTAQVSQIDIEDNSWFVCFAPYDEPEIVIAVCIPNGLGSIYSANTAKAVLEYYFDNKTQVQASELEAPGSLAP
ncbi:MAG: penicillin-binding transpeptidase domain-containing protein, partial [Christensenellales bacterium]